jgi:hypothetical protein
MEIVLELDVQLLLSSEYIAGHLHASSQARKRTAGPHATLRLWIQRSETSMNVSPLSNACMQSRWRSENTHTSKLLFRAVDEPASYLQDIHLDID